MNPIRFSAAKIVFHETPLSTHLKPDEQERLNVIRAYSQISELLNADETKDQLTAMDDSVKIEFYPHQVYKFQFLPGGAPPSAVSELAHVSLTSNTEQNESNSLLQPLSVAREFSWSWIHFSQQLQSINQFVNQVIDTAKSLDAIKKLQTKN